MAANRQALLSRVATRMDKVQTHGAAGGGGQNGCLRLAATIQHCNAHVATPTIRARGVVSMAELITVL